jgi:hypothetical protein
VDLPSVRFSVVEVFEPCPCHTAIVVRRNDLRHWVILFVRNPAHIRFGDIIQGKPSEVGPLDGGYVESFGSGLFWLVRGPTLRFRLIIDDIPPNLGEKLLEEIPCETDSSEDSSFPNRWIKN